MADQDKEQLVIEAVLKDLVSAQAGKIVDALKKANKEIDAAGGGAGSAAAKGPEEVTKSLTKLLPVARRAGGELLNMAGELGKFGRTATGSLREAGSILQEIGVGAGTAGTGLATLGLAVTGVAAVGTVLGLAAKNAYDLDKSFNVVRVSADLTTKQQEELNAAIQEWRTEGIDADESAKTLSLAFRVLTKDTNEASSATASVLKAFKVDVGQAAPDELMRSLAGAMKAFGLTAKDTDQTLGMLYAVSRKTGDGMSEVAQALTELGPLARVANVRMEDVAATLASTSDAAGGLGNATSSIASVLSQLTKTSSPLSVAFRELGLQARTGADGFRDLHGILEQVGELEKQLPGALEKIVGESRGASSARFFASAADGAKDYVEALDKIRNGTSALDAKTREFSKVASEEVARAFGKLKVAGSAFGSGILQPFKDLAVAVTGSWVEDADTAAKNTEKLATSVQHVAKSLGHLDLSSPLARQIGELSAQARPIALGVTLAPDAKAALTHDITTLENVLRTDKLGLKIGQIQPDAAQALARVAQTIAAIEQAQAISADLATRGASGYAKQRLEIEGAGVAFSKLLSHLQLAGVRVDGLRGQMAAAVQEMQRAVDAQNRIQGLSLQGQVLTAQRQGLQAELEIAKARGDAARIGEVTVKIDELDGQIIDANAQRASAAIAEQFRGKSDLLALAQKQADAERAAADAQRDAARYAFALEETQRRGDVARQLAESVKASSDYTEDQIRATTILRQLDRDRLELATRALPYQEEILRYYDRQTEILRQQFEISGSFRRGMDEVLRTYADTAQRLYDSGKAFITSFHDEGARSLSDFAKGNLSGKDALRQFGQGVLGSAIDQGSSLLFDQITTGIFGQGKRPETAGDKMLDAAQVFATAVDLFARTNGAAFGPVPVAGPYTLDPSTFFRQPGIATPGITPGAQGPVTEALMQAGQDIQAAGESSASGVKGSGNVLTGALTALGGGIGGIAQGLFSVLQGLFSGGGGPGPGFIGPILQAQGGVWGGTLLPVRAAGGGIFRRPTLLQVAEIAGKEEAVVPMERGGIMADMGRGGPRVHVAGADIPLRFRGGSPGGSQVTTINVAPEIHVHAHSLDPRGAADVVLAQMPEIQKAITTALVRGSDRALRDAVQGAAR